MGEGGGFVGGGGLTKYFVFVLLVLKCIDHPILLREVEAEYNH